MQNTIVVTYLQSSNLKLIYDRYFFIYQKVKVNLFLKIANIRHRKIELYNMNTHNQWGRTGDDLRGSQHVADRRTSDRKNDVGLEICIEETCLARRAFQCAKRSKCHYKLRAKVEWEIK